MEKCCIMVLFFFDYFCLLCFVGVLGYIFCVVVNLVIGFSSLEYIIVYNCVCGFFVCNVLLYLNYGGLGRGVERFVGFCDDWFVNFV